MVWKSEDAGKTTCSVSVLYMCDKACNISMIQCTYGSVWIHTGRKCTGQLQTRRSSSVHSKMLASHSNAYVVSVIWLVITAMQAEEQYISSNSTFRNCCKHTTQCQQRWHRPVQWCLVGVQRTQWQHLSTGSDSGDVAMCPANGSNKTMPVVWLTRCHMWIAQPMQLTQYLIRQGLI